jgi:hypothetical protein
LVALAPRDVSAVVGVVRFVAIAAALIALVAFRPRSYPATELRVLRDRYVSAASVFTRRRVMDTQILMIEETGDVLREKAKVLKWAHDGSRSGALLVASALPLDEETLWITSQNQVLNHPVTPPRKRHPSTQILT